MASDSFNKMPYRDSLNSRSTEAPNTQQSVFEVSLY